MLKKVKVGNQNEMDPAADAKQNTLVVERVVSSSKTNETKIRLTTNTEII
jgi:hypothetical protein